MNTNTVGTARRVPGWLIGACALIAAQTVAGPLGCETARGVRKDFALLTSSGAKDTSAVGKFAFTDEPDVRVRIAGGVSSKAVSGVPEIVVRPVAGAEGSPVVVKTPATVTSSASGVKVVHPAGQATFGFGVDVEIAPKDTGGSLLLDKVRYPGVVAIRPRWSGAPGAFDVIVSMPVESYLPGVLTHELWKDWPRQTYEAQAIAARTYALHERSRARIQGRPYDVEDTTNDQVYGGATAAAKPNEAARATRGLVLVSDGRLLRAYYSSTCGGRAASAAAVWKTTQGYEFNLADPLQGKERPHACQGSKWYRWEATRSDDDVTQRLRAWGRQFEHDVATIGRVRQATVAKTNDAGRPDRFTLTDDKGRTYSLTSEELRMALNQTGAGLAPIPADAVVRSGDMQIEVWANQVKITGRGWGHGVGMCQWCAKGLADQGQDWASMIREFYPGAEVVKAY
ncbi:MAG: SpoIID/LytB domain-containing protein [Planctomycetota bacterium]|nr:SpoIID/LytB domain-containing protein [Planctomycetota bacterium]